MTHHHLAETYLARAQELEDFAERLERISSSASESERQRESTFLRREAAWWRAYARTLAESA
jgi:hypothetical protein